MIIKDFILWFLYIIKCSDLSLYTGITTDIQRRMAVHESGKGAKYCRGRTPLELVYSQEFKNRSDASKAEIKVKRMTKKEKLELVLSAKQIII